MVLISSAPEAYPGCGCGVDVGMGMGMGVDADVDVGRGGGRGPPAPTPTPTLAPRLACRLAVRASIFFSSSATRLSVFFCLFLVGCVTRHSRPAFAHRLHGPSGLSRSGSHLTLRPRQASQARGRLGSLGSWGVPSPPSAAVGVGAGAMATAADGVSG